MTCAFGSTLPPVAGVIVSVCTVFDTPSKIVCAVTELAGVMAGVPLTTPSGRMLAFAKSRTNAIRYSVAVAPVAPCSTGVTIVFPAPNMPSKPSCRFAVMVAGVAANEIKFDCSVVLPYVNRKVPDVVPLKTSRCTSVLTEGVTAACVVLDTTGTGAWVAIAVIELPIDRI